MSLNRREMLRLGACGATAAIISTAASSSVLPTLLAQPVTDPLAPLPEKHSARLKDAPTGR